MSQYDSISPTRHLLSQKREHFNFPPSLVFAAPPTKDSSPHQPGIGNQLLSPNSHHPLSLSDSNSLAVVSYEYLLVEHLGILNGHASVPEVETIKEEILDTLRYLDQKKGTEWNKQLRAQLNPNAFIISGEDYPTCP